MRSEQCPRINPPENIQKLAEIAGVSVKNYKKMRGEAEQAAYNEELRKNEAVEAGINARLDRDRRNLIEEGQTFDSRAMTSRGGFKRIKSGGRTSIAA